MMHYCFCSVIKAWGTNLAQIFLFPKSSVTIRQTVSLPIFKRSAIIWRMVPTVFCQQTTNRFHVFVCSGSRRTTTSGIVLHVLPSVLKGSIPQIHISTTHGSATISLTNQFDRFHSTFTGINTKFNCYSLLLHDTDHKAKNLHLQNKFVLTDHWTKTIEAWSRVTWSIVPCSYSVGR